MDNKLKTKLAMFILFSIFVVTGCSVLDQVELESSAKDKAEPSIGTTNVSELRIIPNLEANALIADLADRVQGAEISYQWLRDGSEIIGEKSKVYFKEISDCSKDIQVKVSILDGGK